MKLGIRIPDVPSYLPFPFFLDYPPLTCFFFVFLWKIYKKILPDFFASSNAGSFMKPGIIIPYRYAIMTFYKFLTQPPLPAQIFVFLWKIYKKFFFASSNAGSFMKPGIIIPYSYAIMTFYKFLTQPPLPAQFFFAKNPEKNFVLQLFVAQWNLVYLFLMSTPLPMNIGMLILYGYAYMTL